MSKNREQRSKNKGLFKRMTKKLWIAFLVICIAFTVLVGRVMYIQYTSGGRYEKQVLSQMSYDSALIPYKRGDIVDTNGTIIATSIDVYALILDCYLLGEDEEVISSTASAIERFFPEVNGTDVKKIARDNPQGRYNILLKNISYDDMEAFTEYKNEEANKGKIQGVWFEKSYKRYYPYDTLASDVVGFANAEGGVIGLENAYNKDLSGINGRTYGYLDEDSTRERHTENAVNGQTLVTTIDINIQNILENEIKSFNDRVGGGDGAKGSLQTSAIIMDPRNGEILAMADYPNFNLNNPRDLSHIYSQEDLDLMTADEKFNAMNYLWQNYCITHTYEPGSTFKPFTVAAGLETGKLVGDEVFYCNGGEKIGPNFISCVNRNGHGQETIADSLSDSCNDALMQMAARIGASNFAYYQRLFGFGQRTNIDITGEARTDSLIYGEKDLGKAVNLATNSFGQNFNVTMIQLATAFASLINGGYLYEPHVVKQMVDPSGVVSKTTDPVIEKVTVSKEISNMLRGYLRNVVATGTGRTAGVDGYAIGGKTGTAEKLPRDKRSYLVSFIGFAPTDNPELLIYVVVDEPAVADQAHSSYAQEIVHGVLQQVLPYLNIKKEQEE